MIMFYNLNSYSPIVQGFEDAVRQVLCYGLWLFLVVGVFLRINVLATPRNKKQIQLSRQINPQNRSNIRKYFNMTIKKQGSQ